MHIRFLALAAMLAANPAAARLSPAEQRMIATVDAEQPRTLALLQRWVEVNSGTMNAAGVRAVGDLVAPELTALGFTVSWLDMRAAGRSGHLVAHHPGRGHRKRLLLIGHLDTVFEPDSPLQHWSIDGDGARGPGAVDDKGGDAVMIAALRAMHAAGTLRNADITVVLTGDEEEAGSPIAISRAPLIAAGKVSDAALDFEILARGDGVDFGTIGRRSALSWTLTVTADSFHSAGVLQPKAGAIYEIARIVDSFRRELPEPDLSYNVGLVVGGATAALDGSEVRGTSSGKTNIVAGQAVARGDVRTISNAQTDRVRQKMSEIVARSLPGTRAWLAFDDSYYPPVTPTAGNRALLARLNGVNADLGLPAMGELDPAERGAGDIGFVAVDVDSLIGMGPAGSGTHTVSERVDIPSIAKQAKRAAILMSRLASERREKR